MAARPSSQGGVKPGAAPWAWNHANESSHGIWSPSGTARTKSSDPKSPAMAPMPTMPGRKGEARPPVQVTTAPWAKKSTKMFAVAPKRSPPRRV